MKTRIFLLVLVMLSTASYALAEEFEATVSTSSLTVYSRMTRSASVSGRLGRDTRVIVEWVHEDMESKWCGIRKLGDSFTLGYVECKYLSSSDPATDSQLTSGDLRPYPDVSVILYSTTTCGFCKRAKHMLEGMGVNLVEYYIDRDRSRGDEMRQKGGHGVPFIDVEGIYISGYAPARIKQAVEERRKR